MRHPDFPEWVNRLLMLTGDPKLHNQNPGRKFPSKSSESRGGGHGVTGPEMSQI